MFEIIMVVNIQKLILPQIIQEETHCPNENMHVTPNSFIVKL